MTWTEPKDCPFGRLSRSKDGLRSSCKKCVRDSFSLSRRLDPERARRTQRASYERNIDTVKARALVWSKKNPEKKRQVLLETKYVTRWHARLVSGCKVRFRDQVCEIDPEFVLSMFERQGGKCYWLGVPLVISKRSNDPRRPSIDRIDNSKGYIRDNVVLSCQFANLGRRSTPAPEFSCFVEELKAVMANSLVDSL